MLPFTTYNIPESTERETQLSEKWLWVIVGTQLSAPEEDLLNKICTALKADFINDVSIIFTGTLDNNLLVYSDGKGPKLILSFGHPPATMGIWIDLNVPGIRFLESMVFILASPLEELIKSPLAKKQLWNSMQLFLDMK